MLRRVVFAPRILQASSGRPRRVSGSATEDKGKQEQVARETHFWPTCKQVSQKNWEALLTALAGLGCLAYTYCTDTFQVWWTSDAILAVPFKPTEEATYVRDVVTEKAEVLRTYVRNFDKRRRGSFVLVAGPQASGKTTSIETAFDGWKGVRKIQVKLDAEAVSTIDFAEVLSRQFKHLKGLSDDVARERVSVMDDYCQQWYNHPLVIVISIKSGNKPLESQQAVSIAGKILDFGRGSTYDAPTCPVIFETSVPKVCVPQSACTKLHGPTDRRRDHESLRQHLQCGVPPSHEP